MIQAKTLASGDKVYRVRVGNGPMRTFTRKNDALEYEGQQKRNRARVRTGLESTEIVDTTFDELAAMWCANFNPSHWKFTMLTYSKTRWGRHQLSSLRPEQIGAWLHDLPYASKTKSHILSTLRAVLDAGVEWGYLARNPARTRAFKAPSTKRVRPILPFETWAEVETAAGYVAIIGEPISSPLIRFACATGLRVPGELMAMRWEDVSFFNRQLIVRGTKTDAAARVIPLSTNAIQALKDVARGIARGGPVWINRHGRKLSYINWRDTDWREGLERAGLERRTPYEMRHTFATLALGAGAAIDDVASAMGHTDIDEVYRFYRKWIPQSQDRLRGVLNTIGKETDAAVRSSDSRPGR